MKVILRKDNCLAAIHERLAKVKDENWNEIDANAIAKFHLPFVDGVLSSIKEKKTANDIWDHLTKLYKAKSIHNKIFLRKNSILCVWQNQP